MKHLLCLTTAAEIVLLGVTFGSSGQSGETSNDGGGSSHAEMNVLPEPLFTLSTDSTHMLCVKGTDKGRIFLGKGPT